MALWIAGFAALALALYVAVTFNELIRARNRVRAAWADIDVQLQRRHDLVPQLATTVKAYADHEKAALNAVTEMRARAQASVSVAQRGQIEGNLSAQLARLLALQEQYPDLKASGNFLQLQRDLVGIEDALQAARSVYNEVVRAYNTQIQQFPDVLLARPFGFQTCEFFQADAVSAVRV
ncbi:MAG: LemA family protein [Proteobacteria bacterium]|nr:LemA family protein [Pseudomonadota bacterium]